MYVFALYCLISVIWVTLLNSDKEYSSINIRTVCRHCVICKNVWKRHERKKRKNSIVFFSNQNFFSIVILCTCIYNCKYIKRHTEIFEIKWTCVISNTTRPGLQTYLVQTTSKARYANIYHMYIHLYVFRRSR